ncbi:RagB/SusD family nutrient uptake outer membrane protein [Chryseobacterium gallinarum]|uniref:RagB/SusD family nutrient uptake outer membrane protein n=1 Tax=Chryseobacterium gallinarum TaxID=1324352 RepID=UPI0020245C0C|nr:RagB/SusD family nutrient uptake outer membrane protein [Chryseobacterium gallinarum]MCL8537670.1 RagB/SusD family nutrient uptake outer membrane protein [Chryseobacterium gallinarum]
MMILPLIVLMIGCTRFLEEKSDLKLATPETLEDNQALLDQVQTVIANTSSSGEVSSDDFYLTDADYKGLLSEEDKRLYSWQPDHVSVTGDNDWQYCYKAIYTANSVLFNIETYHIPGADNIKGQALAIRAARYLDAAQIWCLVYNPATASTDLGLPLRLDPDMNIPSVRASVQQTYSQILGDLHQALPLLPIKQIAATRPSKIAVLGLLARTYLWMGNYPKALENALEALTLNNSLMDYNMLNPSDAYPIKEMNVEVLFSTTINLSSPITPSRAKVPLPLYQSYGDNDLRKSIFFKTNTAGEILYRGNYTGRTAKLTGIAIDELYLIAAECYARAGDIALSMKTLNELLITRWKTGTFIPFSVSSKEEALALVLKERRKELMYRGLRWPDIKRLNRDGSNIILSRSINGQMYTLLPNDLRYAIAIPEDVIALTGMPQNKR